MSAINLAAGDTGATFRLCAFGTDGSFLGGSSVVVPANGRAMTVVNDPTTFAFLFLPFNSASPGVPVRSINAIGEDWWLAAVKMQGSGSVRAGIVSATGPAQAFEFGNSAFIVSGTEQYSHIGAGGVYTSGICTVNLSVKYTIHNLTARVYADNGQLLSESTVPNSTLLPLSRTCYYPISIMFGQLRISPSAAESVYRTSIGFYRAGDWEYPIYPSIF